MFCSECGKKAQGKFCWHCGAALTAGDAPEAIPPDESHDPTPAAPIDWNSEVRYEVLLRDQMVRTAVDANARRAKKKMTGEEYLALFDKVVPVGVPLEKVAAVVRPLYARLGVGMTKERAEDIDAPVGKVLVRALCSLARNGQEVRGVKQESDGCVVETVLPSDLFSFEGDVRLSVHRGGGGTHAAAQVKIAGQYFDWGKSRRYLEQLFDDLRKEAA